MAQGWEPACLNSGRAICQRSQWQAPFSLGASVFCKVRALNSVTWKGKELQLGHPKGFRQAAQ